MLQVIAISLGASIGALARWQLGLWLNQGHAVLPWGTAIVVPERVGIVVRATAAAVALSPLAMAAACRNAVD
jgi:fluoride ion exporter CrcB/FEX